MIYEGSPKGNAGLRVIENFFTLTHTHRHTHRDYTHTHTTAFLKKLSLKDIRTYMLN